ncbi:SDR family oxidoreductase [Symbioplanes lichenis]|uniref:SDR family oxidoreductase n=1 Tax=Symbioplanes lichenis TaxID=1629072 RepID=UPI002738CA4D|nr:SDR family oxidoreductase [Actinoplanes lichenis]
MTRTALITASSRGIGRAIALRLSRDGASVAVNYQRNETAAKEVVATIEQAGGKAVAVRADIADPADITRLFEEAAGALGGLDIVVNNAGVRAFGAVAEMPLDVLDSILAVNVRGTFLVMQQAARVLRDGGRIINISTGHTREANPNVAAYGGGKTAAEYFARVLAKELGSRRITVNSVLPGLTDTDGLSPDFRANDALLARTPLGRLGRPEDIADVVAFLAGDDARWVTGDTIAAAGGLV